MTSAKPCYSKVPSTPSGLMSVKGRSQSRRYHAAIGEMVDDHVERTRCGLPWAFGAAKKSERPFAVSRSNHTSERTKTETSAAYTACLSAGRRRVMRPEVFLLSGGDEVAI